MTPAASQRSSKRLSNSDRVRLVAPLVLYGVLAVVAWKLGFFHGGGSQKVTAAVEGATGKPWFAAAFVLAYAIIGALALPLSLLAYGAGAVFGFWRGSILVWIASMFGALAGYYLARGVWAKPARRLLGRYAEKLHDLRKGNVLLTAFRMQLLPVVPFGAFNYAAGISKLPMLEYLAGTAIGIIPGTLMATFIGDRLAAGIGGHERKPLLIAGAVVLVVLALSFLPKLLEKLRRRRSRHR
ncbi:MAG: VTT domain-containing protein [Gemmatimonadota bacterium]|nr:VTT domain-containing protein [Gemmatimonadota bacterium]